MSRPRPAESGEARLPLAGIIAPGLRSSGNGGPLELPALLREVRMVCRESFGCGPLNYGSAQESQRKPGCARPGSMILTREA